jgi:hypothetical protein
LPGIASKADPIDRAQYQRLFPQERGAGVSNVGNDRLCRERK